RETKQAAAQVVTGQTADHGVAALTHAAHLNTRADAVDHDTATTDGGGESGDDFLREEHLLGEALDLHATTETVGQHGDTTLQTVVHREIGLVVGVLRSEERRVGYECRTRRESYT